MDNVEKIAIGLVLFIVTSVVAYLFRMRQLYVATPKLFRHAPISQGGSLCEVKQNFSVAVGSNRGIVTGSNGQNIRGWNWIFEYLYRESGCSFTTIVGYIADFCNDSLGLIRHTIGVTRRI